MMAERTTADEDEATEIVERVRVSPDWITFTEPFTQRQRKLVVVINPTTEMIGFRVNSSNPSILLVCPELGIIAGGEEVHVAVYFGPWPVQPYPAVPGYLTFSFASVPRSAFPARPFALQNNFFQRVSLRVIVGVSFTLSQRQTLPIMSQTDEQEGQQDGISDRESLTSSTVSDMDEADGSSVAVDDDETGEETASSDEFWIRRPLIERAAQQSSENDDEHDGSEQWIIHAAAETDSAAAWTAEEVEATENKRECIDVVDLIQCATAEEDFDEGGESDEWATQHAHGAEEASALEKEGVEQPEASYHKAETD